MKWRTPSFWYYNTFTARLLAMILSPFSALYYLGHRLQQAGGKPARVGVPVLCIGNLVAGGSGKTPAALALMALIREHKLAENPCFLSRGYGGKARGPILVDPALHDAATVGDEPLLLCQAAPTIVSTDRAAGGRHAVRAGFDLILMDDGLQNRSLARDVNFLAIDAETGFGNGHMLPAGPLRQPVKAGLKNIHAVILIGEKPITIAADVRVFKAAITPAGKQAFDHRSRYLAFTGLAQPEKFRRTILDLPLNLAGWRTFPDHHPYTPQDFAGLIAEAEQKNACLLTTAKDAIRLPPPEREKVNILHVNLVWQSVADVVSFVKSNLRQITP